MAKKQATKTEEPEELVSMLDIKLKSIRDTMKTSRFRIEGVTPLCVTRWTKKALLAMQIAQGLVVDGDLGERKPRVPREDYLEYFYMIKGEPETKGCIYGIPAIWLKCAIVDAIAFLGVKKVYLKTGRAAIFVKGESGVFDQDTMHDLIPIIDHTPPRMWTGTVRNGGRGAGADLRYRPLFDKWAVEFDVRYDDTLISPQILAALIDRAGVSVGIGDWRPQSKTGKGGPLGTFKIAQPKTR